MNVKTKRKLETTLILLTILVPTALFSVILLKQENLVSSDGTLFDEDANNFYIDKETIVIKIHSI